jgi:hypothetical protein
MPDKEPTQTDISPITFQCLETVDEPDVMFPVIIQELSVIALLIHHPQRAHFSSQWEGKCKLVCLFRGLSGTV